MPMPATMPMPVARPTLSYQVRFSAMPGSTEAANGSQPKSVPLPSRKQPQRKPAICSGMNANVTHR